MSEEQCHIDRNLPLYGGNHCVDAQDGSRLLVGEADKEDGEK